MTRLELLDALAGSIAADRVAVWVTVVATRGSTPREAGASMLVDSLRTAGSIGGGQLEWRAVELARTMLADCAGLAAPLRRIEHFALGARLGQCCGGEVKLAFDVVRPTHAAWLDDARSVARAGGDWQSMVARHLPPGDGYGHDTLRVALFGAGHVGRALAELLGRLPLRVTWIDTRDDAFPPLAALNVTCIVSDAPESEIRDLPPDCASVIMTQSHALDLALVQAWLDRNDFRFLGLIGSHTKRARFEHQLRARGYDDSALARIACPIGISDIRGKEPEVIAIAVAAQLLGLRQPRETPQG
jgi:xanthine dehydrogenase accessory factor